MTTELIAYRPPYANIEMRCLPCKISPSIWPFDPDFWICPKCEATYVKKCLFNRVKSFEKIDSQYDLRVNIIHMNGGVGYIQISKKDNDGMDQR